MEYVQISKQEYAELLKCKQILVNIEEDIHEELNVKQVTDPRAIAKLKQLDKEVKEGKRKTFSKEQFLEEFKD